MRIGRNEIIEQLTEHMRQFGGDDWCVGTTTDGKWPIQDSREDPNMMRLAYREAHTPYAAAEAVEYLASAFGLQPARESRPGHIVFVHRLTHAGASTPRNAASGPHHPAAA